MPPKKKDATTPLEMRWVVVKTWQTSPDIQPPHEDALAQEFGRAVQEWAGNERIMHGFWMASAEEHQKDFGYHRQFKMILLYFPEKSPKRKRVNLKYECEGAKFEVEFTLNDYTGDRPAQFQTEYGPAIYYEFDDVSVTYFRNKVPEIAGTALINKNYLKRALGNLKNEFEQKILVQDDLLERTQQGLEKENGKMKEELKILEKEMFGMKKSIKSLEDQNTELKTRVFQLESLIMKGERVENDMKLMKANHQREGQIENPDIKKTKLTVPDQIKNQQPQSSTGQKKSSPKFRYYTRNS